MRRSHRTDSLTTLAVPALIVLLGASGCLTPIGARTVSPRHAYLQSRNNALSGDGLSNETMEVIHRYDLENAWNESPDAVVRELHARACTDVRRDVLCALSEVCYSNGERLGSNWPQEARSQLLASVIYAYLYLFGECPEPLPAPTDPHIRLACELYNWGLVRCLSLEEAEEPAVDISEGARKLPVGRVRMAVDSSNLPWTLDMFEKILPAARYEVHGLTLRNRTSGLGAALIGVHKRQPGMPLQRSVPISGLLRVQGGIRDLEKGSCTVTMELHSGYTHPIVDLAGRKVPLEGDTTAPLAYMLNNTFIWGLGSSQFFSGEQQLKSGIYPTHPYRPGLIPVVFVHGTFSSPVWWAEMWNTLLSDSVLSRRCQFWNFLYNSGNPITYSAANFRDALKETLKSLDPEGKDQALQQMVVIGHSQGGLLTKLTVTDSGSALWSSVSKADFDSVEMDKEDRAELRRNLFVEPLPFVKRLIFISTPHRGSYLATGWVRKFVARFVSFPLEIANLGNRLMQLRQKLGLPSEVRHGIPTSLDSMSPENKMLLTLASMPPAGGVPCHSIIAVQQDGDPALGNDGVVEYKSAHLDYAESEFVVRSGHSCQGNPRTIEEVRRILLEHISKVDALQRPQESTATEQKAAAATPPR